eukprot:176129-Pleurochrysis_carterae.AAC.1
MSPYRSIQNSYSWAPKCYKLRWRVSYENYQTVQKRIKPKNVQNGYWDTSRNPAPCELRYRDRLANEIAIS